MRSRLATLASAAALAAALASASCRGAGIERHPLPLAGPCDAGTTGDWSINRGDWLVGEKVGLWTVNAHPRTGAPVRVGYVTERHYREVRGGPVFQLFEVTNLDRSRAVGTVDALGNAKRFRPRQGGGFDTEAAGNSTLALGVQAILESSDPVTLDPTSERALAFEMLDANRDGVLEPKEFPRLSSKLANADRNGDGKVDFQEFETAEGY
jgi:hypothetical protein